MAFETGASSSANDLLDKLRIFAAANGWTVDANGARTDGTTGNFVVMRRGTAVYAVFFTDQGAGSSVDPGPYIGCYTYPGPYNSGANAMAQANKTTGSLCNKMTGPFQAYYFFASGDYLHAVVEISPGLFRHFGVGLLESAGGVTTGAYNHALRWHYGTTEINSAVSQNHAVPFDSNGSNSGWHGTDVRADSDGTVPRNVYVFDQAAADPNGGWAGWLGSNQHAGSPVHSLARVAPSTLTGRAVLLPLLVAVDRPSGNVSFVGSPRDMRLTRIDNLAPGASVTIGADTWRVFPVVRKNGAVGTESSLAYAYAYRVVP